jgi:hypothetical protein
MIAWEGLAFEDDLVLAVNVWVVEGRHQEMQIGCQSLHNGNFGLVGANNGSNQLRRA